MEDTRTKEQTGQVPSVGRIVHWVRPVSALDPYGEHLAAIVTGVNDDDSVDLCVFFRDRAAFFRDVRYDAKGPADTWHWCERVP